MWKIIATAFSSKIKECIFLAFDIYFHKTIFKFKKIDTMGHMYSEFTQF